MAVLTVRNVPEEVRRALRVRAANNGRSTEAEIRDILESAVKPEQRLCMGDALAKLGRHAGLGDKDFASLQRTRAAADPMGFE